MYSEKRKFGNKGEDVACRFLESKKYKILERNFLRKYGEIDIIVEKDSIIHFIEVKTLSREIGANSFKSFKNREGYRPEDNIHPKKLERIRRVLQVFLLENSLDDRDWEFDVIAVILDENEKVARVKFVKDIVL